MFYVYVLENEEGDLYKGFTNNIKNRLKEHNSGQNLSTKNKKWRCIYYECCLNEQDARRRERYLKTSQGSRLLKRRLKEYFYNRRRG